MLDAMPVSQWLEWKAWREIRGPLGPDRWDFYVAFLAMNMGPNPYPRGAEVTLADFRMPWLPEPVGSDIDPDDEE